MEYFMQAVPEQLPDFYNLVTKVCGLPSSPINASYQILHPAKQMLIIAPGKKDLEISVFNERIHLSKDEMLFINKNALYLVENEADSTYYEISLPEKICSFWPGSYMEQSDVKPVIEEDRLTYSMLHAASESDRQIMNLVRELIDLYYSTSSSNLIYRLAVKVVDIYAHLLAVLPDVSDRKQDKDAQIACKVISFIEENYADPISQKQLAEFADVRIAVLDQIFQSHVACSPIKYLIRYRLFASTNLLKKSKMKVQEVANSVGFNAPSSFILQFKKEFGTTPKDYRSTYLKSLI